MKSIIDINYEDNFMFFCSYAFNRITLGDLQLDSETRASFTTDIADHIGHEWYDDDSTDYDYAMLRLEERAPIGNYIQPACLAQSQREHESYRNCYIVGWGLTAEGRYQWRSVQGSGY